MTKRHTPDHRTPQRTTIQGEWALCQDQRPQLLQVAQRLGLSEYEYERILSLAYGQVQRSSKLDWFAAGLATRKVRAFEAFRDLAVEIMMEYVKGPRDATHEAFGDAIYVALRSWSHFVYHNIKPYTLRSWRDEQGKRRRFITCESAWVVTDHDDGYHNGTFLHVSKNDDIEDLVNDIGNQQMVARALEGLSPEDQENIRIFLAHETHRERAEEKGMHVETWRHRLRKTLEKCRLNLESAL